MSTKSVRQGGRPTAETPPTSMAQASVTRITPPTKTTTTNSSSTTDRHFQVDKNIVDELLLVCSVIGSHDENSGKFVPVTDCLQWLQDLQRALRRDDDLFRPISLLVGDWRIVETKLVPLALACRYDTALLLTICKILVILTKPLATATQRAAVLAIDTKSAKAKKPEYKRYVSMGMSLIHLFVFCCFVSIGGSNRRDFKFSIVLLNRLYCVYLLNRFMLVYHVDTR